MKRSLLIAFFIICGVYLVSILNNPNGGVSFYEETEMFNLEQNQDFSM